MKRFLAILLLLSGLCGPAMAGCPGTVADSTGCKVFSLSEEQLRGKKVALVLCGGGAKGDRKSVV